MGIVKGAARLQHHRLTTAASAFTVPPSEDFTDGTWSITDLALGEIGINLADDTAFFRTTGGIFSLQTGRDPGHAYGTPSLNGGVTLELGYGLGKLLLTNGSAAVVGTDGADFSNTSNFDSPAYYSEASVLLADGSYRDIYFSAFPTSTTATISAVYNNNQGTGLPSATWDGPTGEYQFWAYGAGRATGENSLAALQYSNASAANTLAIGGGSNASAIYANALGAGTTASGQYSLAMGRNTSSTGTGAISIGKGFDGTRKLLSAGTGSVNISYRSVSTAGKGEISTADYAGMFAGLNHAIGTGATGSVIIGGQTNIVSASVVNSVIIGGTGITAAVSNTVYVPALSVVGSITGSTGVVAVAGIQLTGDAQLLNSAALGTITASFTFTVAGAPGQYITNTGQSGKAYDHAAVGYDRYVSIVCGTSGGGTVRMTAFVEETAASGTFYAVEKRDITQNASVSFLVPAGCIFRVYGEYITSYTADVVIRSRKFGN